MIRIKKFKSNDSWVNLLQQNEVQTKKRRGTIAEENISKSKSTPKVLAIKSGLRATNKQKFGKRKSSVKLVIIYVYKLYY